MKETQAMRPNDTIIFHQHQSHPSIQGFAEATSGAYRKLLIALDHPSSVYTHMGQGPVSVDPSDQDFLESLARDLGTHRKVLLTVRWGAGEDDWETLCLCSATSPAGPSIVAMWVGQEAHEQIKAHSAKLMSSNWDGRTESVPEIIGSRGEPKD